MSKRAVNLWLEANSYDWLKSEAKRRGVTMTSLLRDLICKERRRLDESRRPQQY